MQLANSNPTSDAQFFALLGASSPAPCATGEPTTELIPCGELFASFLPEQMPAGVADGSGQGSDGVVPEERSGEVLPGATPVFFPAAAVSRARWAFATHANGDMAMGPDKFSAPESEPEAALPPGHGVHLKRGRVIPEDCARMAAPSDEDAEKTVEPLPVVGASPEALLAAGVLALAVATPSIPADTQELDVAEETVFTEAEFADESDDPSTPDSEHIHENFLTAIHPMPEPLRGAGGLRIGLEDGRERPAPSPRAEIVAAIKAHPIFPEKNESLKPAPGEAQTALRGDGRPAELRHEFMNDARRHGPTFGVGSERKAFEHQSESSNTLGDGAVPSAGSRFAPPVATLEIPMHGGVSDMLPKVVRGVSLPSETIDQRSSPAETAAPELTSLGAHAAVEYGADKNFLEAEPELLAKRSKKLGTDVARSGATMASHTLSPSVLPETAMSSRLEAAVPIATVSAEKPASDQNPIADVAPIRDAHAAVEVVLRATERLMTGDQKSVSLQFSVGDTLLDVRVELHANQIHTQFRTESAELRHALSQEWQQVIATAGHGDRTVRIAPAVFAAGMGEQASANAFAGDNSSRQRDQRAAHESSDRSARAVAAIAGGRAHAADVVSVASRGARTAPLTSRHLHVHA